MTLVPPLTPSEPETQTGANVAPMQTLPDNAQPNLPPDAKCVTVIFNPVSGQGDPEARKNAISEALAQHGYRCQNLETTKEKGARAVAEEAIRDGVDLLAVSGGDGTVVEAMAALIGKNIPLAVFPAGTGNLLSINLGLPREVPDAVHAALFGDRRPLDLVSMTTPESPDKKRYFAIAAGAGYDAEIIKGADRESKNKFGMGAYLLAAIKNLKRRPMRAYIDIDNGARMVRRRAKSVMIANMGRMQGNMEFAPGARPDDGLLDIAILKAETLADWLRLTWSALRRRLNDDPSVEFLTARRVNVVLRPPQPMQFDGEDDPEVHAGFTVEIIPNAIQVMVPKPAPV